MATQPSIMRMLQTRMKSAVKQYVVALDKMNSLADSDDGDAYDAARDRERLLRGVVRGSAQMYIAVANPAEANRKEAINDIEVDYGFPGTRSRPRAKASDTVSKFLDGYYGDGDA